MKRLYIIFLVCCLITVSKILTNVTQSPSQYTYKSGNPRHELLAQNKLASERERAQTATLVVTTCNAKKGDIIAKRGKNAKVLPEIVGFMRQNFPHVSLVEANAGMIIHCAPFGCNGGRVGFPEPPSVRGNKNAREMGGFPKMTAIFQTKMGLCKLATDAHTKYGSQLGWITAPCIYDKSEMSTLLQNLGKLKAMQDTHSWWLLKESQQNSGHGIVLFPSTDLPKILSRIVSRKKEASMIQAYIAQPATIPHIIDERALAMAEASGHSVPKVGQTVYVKVDLRIWGVITALFPAPRVYVSNRGIYRTGSPYANFSMPAADAPIPEWNKFIHVTNNSPKVNAKCFFWSQLDPITGKENVATYSSAGSLNKLFLKTGLNRTAVMARIHRLFFRLAVLSIEAGVDDGASPMQRFIPINADIGVDSDGEVYLYETHVGCPLKPWGSGDTGSGLDPVVTPESRASFWGILTFGFAAQLYPKAMRKVCSNRNQTTSLCSRDDYVNLPNNEHSVAHKVIELALLEEQLAYANNFVATHRSEWGSANFMLTTTQQQWYHQFDENFPISSFKPLVEFNFTIDARYQPKNQMCEHNLHPQRWIPLAQIKAT